MSDEFDYFNDPRIGKLLDLVLQLSTDVHVIAQRTLALEALLVRNGTLKQGSWTPSSPSPPSRTSSTADGRRCWAASSASSRRRDPPSTRCATSGNSS